MESGYRTRSEQEPQGGVGERPGTDLGTIGALYRYNRWANERVLEAVSEIPADTFVRELKRGQGSIRDILTHIVWSEWIWLQRWIGGSKLVFQPADFSHVSPTLIFSPADFPTFDTLGLRFRTVADDLAAFVRGLTVEKLRSEIECVTVQGDAWCRPLWRLLIHAVNHSTYHRGQVAMMLRFHGCTPVATDLVAYEDLAT